jgi:Fe-S-cluster containining protein
MERYECDRCGACCRGTLIVDAEYLDVVREPRLLEADKNWHGKSFDSSLEELRDDMKVVLLPCGTDNPCRFLASDNRCSVYPTRPNACVGMEAGDEQCQMARESMNLPPLVSTASDVAEDRDGK